MSSSLLLPSIFLKDLFQGTARGDPTEANWAGESFGRDDELTIGSVKGNIGLVQSIEEWDLTHSSGTQSHRNNFLSCLAFQSAVCNRAWSYTPKC